MRPLQEDVARLLDLMAEGSSILQPMRGNEGDAGGGGDIDCVVRGMDPLWPLRLPAGWHLSQRLRYDVTADYWVIDLDGEWIALDVLEDARGLDRLAMRTDIFSMGRGILAPPGERAAYLATKRIWKGMIDEASWRHIGELAADDPERCRDMLSEIFGNDVGPALYSAAASGGAPDRALWRRARNRQRLRYWRKPSHTVALIVGHTARMWHRTIRPTGLWVAVVGPDGTGKSSVAERLLQECSRPMRRTMHLHWRPSVLPRPGGLVGRNTGDTTQPHSRPPHGLALSLALLGYHWLDQIIGGWTKIAPTRARSGLIVMERCWWDIAVDPLRYRLGVPPALARTLGAALRKPDLTIVLEADPRLLLERKREIDLAELTRQLATWRMVLPARARRAHVDASRPLDDVVSACRTEIVDVLEERSMARTGQGWIGIAGANAPRWTLPRGDARTSRSSLEVYHPVTLKGRLGWEAARLFARVGGLRALPRGAAPPIHLRTAVATHIPRRGNIAVARANHPGRYVVLILGAAGYPVSVAKVAIDEHGRRKLTREADAIEELGPLLPEPVRAPEVLSSEDGCLVMRAIPWRPRWNPWRLQAEVAAAMGRFHGAGEGPVHGDLAPWNLLATPDGWALIDWEEARSKGPTYFDVFNHLFRSHVLLGRPAFRDITRGLDGSGEIGDALSAYALAAGASTDRIQDAFIDYLSVEAKGNSEPLVTASRKALLSMAG